MKKIISFIIAIAICLSLTACITDNTNAQNNKEPVSQIEITPDNALLDKLDEWVNITQPGTAGSSLKAINAVKDIIIWAQNNIPEKEIVIATVEEYLENCEYKDEAIDAFNYMDNIFEKITDGTITDFIDGIDFDISSFETDTNVKENIKLLFDAVEQYIDKQQ